MGRAEYFAVTDAEALEAFQRLSQVRAGGQIPLARRGLSYRGGGPRMPRRVQQAGASHARAHTAFGPSYTQPCDPGAGLLNPCAQLEGIIPALETSHALAFLEKLCPTLPNGTRVVLNCSGRGDKDVNTAIKVGRGLSRLGCVWGQGERGAWPDSAGCVRVCRLGRGHYFEARLPC